MSGARAEVADYLRRRFGRRFCVLTNRGTTALTAALHALDRPAGSAALFPAVLCSIPVFAARFAGWAPAFADVNLADANFDGDDVARVLQKGAGRVGAVVPVHMFGKIDDVEGLARRAADGGAALIEDVALSLGAERDGRPAGSVGTLACYSFVRKMIPLEMGGAVMTDDPDLARRARDFIEALPPLRPGEGAETAAALRAFHAVTGYVAAGDWRRRELLDAFEGEFRRLFLARTTDTDWDARTVVAELEKLDDVLRARRARAEVYETALHHPRAIPLDRAGSALFAYPVRLKGWAAEDVLDFAAEQGYTFRRIAYPDVHRVFGPRRSMPNAESVERELVGMPLDDDRPVSDFWGYAADFEKILSAYEKAVPGRRAIDVRGRLEMRMGGLA
jgi:dTDP-4-amino-4,6-dideoxygalactose transaminase